MFRVVLCFKLGEFTGCVQDPLLWTRPPDHQGCSSPEVALNEQAEFPPSKRVLELSSVPEASEDGKVEQEHLKVNWPLFQTQATRIQTTCLGNSCHCCEFMFEKVFVKGNVPVILAEVT